MLVLRLRTNSGKTILPDQLQFLTGKSAVPWKDRRYRRASYSAAGEIVESKSLLRQKKWYKTNKVRLKTQSIVHSVDTKQKTITVNNGVVVNYDKLVIASGAKPRELPDTIGVANAFTLRQPSDANAIRQAANNADSVVIIGGGYMDWR